MPWNKHGALIQNWRLEKRLGAGGQGEVWRVRAKDEHHVPERAIKLCIASDPKGRTRFEREIRLLNELKHHSMLAILDSSVEWSSHGVAEAPEFAFYVSELCDGPLEAQHGLLGGLHERLELFRQACASVRHLHSHSPVVLHRDIKPANFLYAREPRRLVLADLGIARSTDAADDLTGTQEIVGTPHFRAPEVLNGAEGDVRSDVYSLGRILEWLLTGSVSKELASVSRTPRHPDLAEDVCVAIDGVLRRATALSAAQRYQDIDSLLAALPRLFTVLAPEVNTANIERGAEEAAKETVFDRVNKLREASDVVGWRQLFNALRKSLASEALVHGAFMAADPERLRGTSPVEFLAPAMSAIDFGLATLYVENTRFGSGIDLIRDIGAIDAWPATGPRELTEAPDFYRFVYFWLYGAVAHHIGRTDLAMSAARYPLMRGNLGRETEARRVPSLSGYPPMLGGVSSDAYSFLGSYFLRSDALRRIFVSQQEFEVALGKFSAQLVLMEFAESPVDINARHFFFESPPLLMHAKSPVIDTVVRTTFRSRAFVAVVATALSKDVDELVRRWPAYSAHVSRFTMQGREGWFAIPPELTPLADRS